MYIAKNLQFLRRRDKITQEELAEKLNVSRQSVSKWEMGEAYPETEKLIALCELFDVSLDGLMRSDLSVSELCDTNGFSESQMPSDELIAAKEAVKAEPTEFAVYADHMNKFSRAIAIGVALILIGVAICVALEGFALTLPDVTAEVTQIMGGVAVILFVAISVFLFVLYGQRHDSFRKNNPSISQPANTFHRGFAAIMAALISGILLDVVFLVVMNSLIDAEIIKLRVIKDAAMCYVTSAFIAVLAFLVGGLVYLGIQHSKYELKEYENQNAGEKSKSNKLADAICGVIMMVATAVFLILGFIGGYWHPGWIVFPVGGILCGIINTIFNIKKG